MGIRIDKLVVDGFGILHDFVLEPGPGLTVFWGPNEVGKTTLMAFIKAMFFGFPDGRTRENRYEPLRGGEHGGQLFLSDGEGREYIMTLRGTGRGKRTLRRVGSSAELIDFSRLTGGISEELYRSVFAIGLKELEVLETLQRDAVANHIYSAGLGLTTIPLPKIESELVNEGKELFTPRGSRPLINKTLEQLEELDREIEDIRRGHSLYNDLKLDYGDKEGELQRLTVMMKEMQEQERWLQILEQAWASWEGLVQVRDEIEQLPSITNFPADGVGRLDSLADKEGVLKASLTSLGREIGDLEKEIEGLPVDDRLLSLGKEINLLEEERALFTERLQQLPVLQAEGEELARRWQEHCRILGPEWDGKRIQSFDTSLAARAQVDNRMAQLQQLEAALEQARFQLRQAKADLDKIREEAEEARLDWEGFPIPPAPTGTPLGERMTALGEAEEMVPALEEAEKELQHREELLALAWRLAPVPRWLSALLFSLGLLGTVWLLHIGQPVLAVLALAGAAAGLVYALRRPRHLDTEKVRRDIEAQRQNIAVLQDRLSQLSRCLTGKDRLTGHELRQVARDLHREAEARREKERLGEKYREKKEEWERRQGRYENLIGELQEKEKAWEEARRYWQSWLAERDLNPELTPRQAGELLRELERGRELLSQLRQKEGAAAGVMAQLNSYRERVNSLLRLWGEEPVSDLTEVIGVVQDLYRSFQAACQNEQERRGLADLLREKQHLYGQTVDQLRRIQVDLDTLLARGGAADWEEFRLRAEQYHRRRDLLRRERELVSTLTALSPGGNRRKLEQALKNTTITAIQGELRQVQDDLGRLRVEADDLRRELGKLEERIRNLELAEDLSRLLFQRQVLKARMAGYAHDWAAYRTAHKLLVWARTRYERERQPEVLRATTGYFHRITAGRYIRVWAPLGEKSIYVDRKDGKTLSPEELSRGTAEQLYLALRFGLIREYSRRVSSLPVVLDDVVVNFDPERLSSTLEVIGQVAREHQIFFFTCHPHVVAAVQGIVPEADIQKLTTFPQDNRM